MSRAFIIGGGTSITCEELSLLKNECTIAVNKSVFYIKNVNYFITTDYTFLLYLKTHKMYDTWKSLNCKKIFVANCIAKHMIYKNKKVTDCALGLDYDLKDIDETIICNSAHDVGYDVNNFNSGYNSGFCALQYAIIKGYNPIYLLGIDMKSTNRTHFHGGYNWAKSRFDEFLGNYKHHFLSILSKLKKEKPHLKIYSCSRISILNEVIPYKSLRNVL